MSSKCEDTCRQNQLTLILQLILITAFFYCIVNENLFNFSLSAIHSLSYPILKKKSTNIEEEMLITIQRRKRKAGHRNIKIHMPFNIIPNRKRLIRYQQVLMLAFVSAVMIRLNGGRSIGRYVVAVCVCRQNKYCFFNLRAYIMYVSNLNFASLHHNPISILIIFGHSIYHDHNRENVIYACKRI